MTRTFDLESSVQRLLKAGEEISPTTLACMRFFLQHPDIFVSITRNHPAVSCADAANKRRRLGYEGVPLYKELKTAIYVHQTQARKWRLLLAHCSGDRELNIDELKKQVPDLQGELIRFESEALPKGTITPFAFDSEFIKGSMSEHPVFLDRELSLAITIEQLDDNFSVFHLFDREIFSPSINQNGVPYEWDYMTTNFGMHFLGVEIRPYDVYSVLREGNQAACADIVQHNPVNEYGPDATALGRSSEYAHHKIGIITGNSPTTGTVFTARIMASYQDLLGRKGNKGDITNVPVELRSIPQMGESMEMEVRAADVLVTLISAADSLIKSGCSIITLPCNTSDVFKDELSLYCAQKGAIFVSISDSVLDHLRANEIQEFFIIGGQAVSALDRWSSYANLDEKFSARGMPDNLSSLVHEIGFDIKKGADANRVVQRMQAVWAHVQAKGQGKAAAVIALTELSEVFAGPHARALEKLPIRVIDALAVYAERVADVAFNQPRLDRVPDNILPLREGLLHDAIRRSFVRRAAVPGAA